MEPFMGGQNGDNGHAIDGACGNLGIEQKKQGEGQNDEQKLRGTVVAFGRRSHNYKGLGNKEEIG
jgi:hypothetical protein